MVGGVGSAGRLYEPGKQHRADRMAEAGLYEDGKKGLRRPGDPDLRAKELDRDGVDAEVIYGVLAAAAKLSDAEASAEMLRIYNDFIIDFCKHYPDRMIGLACLPFGDVEAAAKEVHRVAKMGVKGVELSCSWDMQPMWHPSWDPLWQAINETQLPLHFHTFPSVDPKLRAGVAGRLAAGVALQQHLPVPDDARQHPDRADGRGGVRALSRTSASCSARAASAGSPTCSTAWTTSTRTSIARLS